MYPLELLYEVRNKLSARTIDTADKPFLWKQVSVFLFFFGIFDLFAVLAKLEVFGLYGGHVLRQPLQTT